MTEKQKLFCLEYLKNGFNATQAAINAGYSKKTAKDIGCENLAKPYIKAYIQEELDKIKSKKIATIEEIQEFWTSILRGEKVDKTPIDDISQNPLSNKIKASELLAKAFQMFVEKQEIKIDADIEIILPDDDPYGDDIENDES